MPGKIDLRAGLDQAFPPIVENLLGTRATMPITILSFLGRHAPAFLAASIFAALALPDLAHVMAPLLGPSVWGLLVIAMVRVEWERVIEHLRRWPRVVGAVFSILVAAPLVVRLIVGTVDLAPGFEAAIVMVTASAPIMSVPAMALMIGLDGALALVVMIVATFVVPFTLPVLSIALLGIDLNISAIEMIGRLTVLVGSALLVSAVIRRVFGPARIAGWKEGLEGSRVILLTVFAIAIMDGITAVLLARPSHVLLAVALGFIANVGLQLATAVLFWKRGRPEALTLGFVSGNRNAGIILAVLPASVDPDIRLYFAMAQFPIYVLPALLRPLYRRLV